MILYLSKWSAPPATRPTRDVGGSLRPFRLLTITFRRRDEFVREALGLAETYLEVEDVGVGEGVATVDQRYDPTSTSE